MKIFITIMLLVSFNANAGWFDFASKPKVLTAKEKAIVENGICGCATGNRALFATTSTAVEYEAQVRPLMDKMNLSIRKTYNIPGSIMCRGWDDYSQIRRGRKTCIGVYSNFGDDRSLKAEGESLK